MKKHVLNIEKLYAGETASALVLSQVDGDLVLLPSVPQGTRNWNAWIRKFKKIHPDFNPGEDISSLDQLNEYVVDFNLNLQTKFKEMGHRELYMMDDTWNMKPRDSDATFSSDKRFLHALNGKVMGDMQGANSSQMNVLFPYRKLSCKSLFSSQLRVRSEATVDDFLEHARGITLQGRVSYEECLQGVARVGDNLYVLSPNIGIGESEEVAGIHGNGLTIVNGFDLPYHFPHSMTLFQPSQGQYKGRNLDKDENGETNFIRWYESHNRKTVVSTKVAHGGNISDIKCLGPGSYELDLATYGPTDIVVGNHSTGNWIHLDSDTFRSIRSGGSTGLGKYEDGKYILDNGASGSVGLMFNLLDTFTSGNDRTLRVLVPRDQDFNKLFLKFDWLVLGEVPHQMEAVCEVGGETAFEVTGTPTPDSGGLRWDGSFTFPVTDAALSDHSIEISVRIHCDLDFVKRNSDSTYRASLRRSGVLIQNLRIENGVDEPLQLLTFGSYVNEDGITEEEHAARYNEFWHVSQYKRDMTYQTVVETPIGNVLGSGLEFPNNYSSGDIYGDIFVTKSILNPQYDMDLTLAYLDRKDWTWTEKEEGGNRELALRAVGRDYIGVNSCSDQLSLVYKPIDIAVEYGDSDDGDSVVAKRVNPNPLLNYQMVEVVKNVNRFESAIKHKSNVFSVVVENSNLAEDSSDNADEELEKYKKQLRDSVTQFVRNTCGAIAPVHTQLLDVQFT